MPYLANPTRFVWHYIATRPYLFIGLAIAVIGASASAVGVQYALKLMMDAMTIGGNDIGAVYIALAVFIGLTLFESVLQRASALILGHATVRTGVRIRLDIFDYLTGHQVTFFQKQRAGSLGHRVSSLSGSFGAIVHRLFLEVAPPLISFAGAIIIFLSIDFWMAIVLGAIFALVTVALVLLGLQGRSHHEDFARRAGIVGGELVDLISNIWVVKAFAARRREVARLRGFLDEEAAAQRRGWFFVERMRAFHDLTLVILVCGTLFWAIGRWSTGAITTGDVVVVSTMTFRILQGSRDLAMALIDTNQQAMYLRETLDVIGVPHMLSDAPGAGPLAVANGTVRLEGVTFGYDPAQPVLHDLSFDVPAGQKVGLVGPSGAGKSSILQLLQRFHDSQQGQVLIDGQRVDLVTQESLHEAVAVVPQEVLLFHRTVMDNIRFARPDASDQEVRRAAEAAHCEAFITQLPQGYDSIVGERGTSLSGGQRQRIGIARAFLKDARIVLLDEATSALDTGSELEVQRGLEALMTDRTVIAVAHRLSTVAGFDRILVLDQGRIVEDGSPQHLLQQPDGAFRRLWMLQADGLNSPEPRQQGHHLELVAALTEGTMQKRVNTAWRRVTSYRQAS